jgi:hypothetical protein
MQYELIYLFEPILIFIKSIHLNQTKKNSQYFEVEGK